MNKLKGLPLYLLIMILPHFFTNQADKNLVDQPRLKPKWKFLEKNSNQNSSAFFYNFSRCRSAPICSFVIFVTVLMINLAVL
jgi:hypothetical protein